MSKAAELAEFGGGISNGPNAVEGLAKSWVNLLDRDWETKAYP